MSIQQRELDNCGFVKAFLMLSVTVYHVILLWRGEWVGINPVIECRLLGEFSGFLHTFHIQAFTLVSGYLFCYLKYEKNKYAQFGPFVINKAKRLLIPFIFVLTVWVAPISGIVLKYSPKTQLENYLLLKNPEQLWFLIMLFCVFVIFWLSCSFFHKHTYIGAAVVLIVYGIGSIGRMFLQNYFCIWSILRYLLFFWMGFKLRQNKDSLLRKIPPIVWLLVHILLYVLRCFLSGNDSLVSKLAVLALEHVLYVVGALSAFFVLQKIACIFDVKNNKVIRFLEKRSFAIYLFHQQFIYFTIIGLNGVVNPYIHALINFAVCMLGSLAIYEILSRFKATRFLIGEKS